MRRDAAFLIAIALAMPLAGASPGVYATIVKYDEADGTIWLDLEVSGAALVYYDAGNDGTFHPSGGTDVLVLHLGSSSTSIEAGDLILSGTSAGSRVTAAPLLGATFKTTTAPGGTTQSVESLFKYREATADGTFGAEDGLYFDTDGSGTVSAEDVRLTRVIITGTTYNFGSLATNSDKDYLTTPALLTVGSGWESHVRLADLTGDGRSNDDPVYFDYDNNQLVGPRDVRWSSFRGLTAGVHPVWSDADVVLLGTQVSGSSFRKHTGTGHILVDLENNGWSAGDLRLTSPGAACPVGSLVKTTDTCDGTTASLETVSAEWKFLDEIGGGLGSDDTIYLHLAGSGTSAIGDVRVTEYAHPGHTTKAAGTKIESAGDEDHGKPLLNLPLTLYHFDADGSGGFSAGDGLYLDGGVAKVVDLGDVRLSPLGALGATRFVALGDADVEPVLRSVPGAGTLAFIDDGSSGYDISDTVILRTASASGAAVANDLRISAGPGGAAGTFIASGAVEEGDATGGSPSLSFRYWNGDGKTYFTSTSFLYATESSTALQVRDTRVSPVTISSTTYDKGTRLVASSKDCCSATTTALTGAVVMFQDRDGNGMLGAADRIYLNVDAAGEAAVSALGSIRLITPQDVRLSGSGGTTTIGAGTSTSSPPAGQTTSTTSTTTTTTTTTTATTTGTTTGTTTTTTTTTPPITLQTIASWNLNIQDSLTIERTPDGNLLSWDEQHGPLGFQVFRSDSPFEEIVQLGPGATSYLDPEGTLDSAYLVTAFYSGGLGFIADANTEDIPGLGVAPEGKTVGGKQAVPGLGIAFIAVVLAGLVAVRRRL